MNKIMVLGVSAGVGKSTFAKKLGNILKLNVCHLDTLFWKPGWVETPIHEFRMAQQQFIANNHQWIIEGNYSATYRTRANEADTIIYLELPLYVCLYRVIKRRLKNRGRTREDMGKGCPEKLDWKFIRFIVTTYHRRKRKMVHRLSEFQSMHPKNKVYVLKNKQEINMFLNNLSSSKQ